MGLTPDEKNLLMDALFAKRLALQKRYDAAKNIVEWTTCRQQIAKIDTLIDKFERALR